MWYESKLCESITNYKKKPGKHFTFTHTKKLHIQSTMNIWFCNAHMCVCVCVCCWYFLNLTDFSYMHLLNSACIMHISMFGCVAIVGEGNSKRYRLRIATCDETLLFIILIEVYYYIILYMNATLSWVRNISKVKGLHTVFAPRIGWTVLKRHIKKIIILNVFF